MKSIIAALLLVFSALSTVFSQDEPFTKETLREYYPILTAITDADLPTQDYFVAYRKKYSKFEMTTDQEVEEILKYRDTLARMLTPHVRRWIAENFDEDYENYFEIRMELNLIMIEPMLYADTLYALFSQTNDFVLETRSSVPFWMYIKYCDARQYASFGKKHGLEIEFLNSYYDIIDIYLEMKESYPKSPYLPMMLKDFEDALVSGLDLYVLVRDAESHVLSSKSGTNLDFGATALDQLYLQSNSNTKYASLVSKLLEDISTIEQEDGQEIKNLFIVSAGSFPRKAEARQARIKYLAEGKVIPHIVQVTTGKTTRYHNVYRFYSNEAKATDTLKKLKTTLPGAVMLKTGADFRFD
jgi:hypothetical protein